ncbi:MAG: MipA/OmpV family protein [Aurantimonas endophytica]|uniref:MipA/OmpV family protein n=1 Tax=Aurantimonas endophytica TaxID=1522175 RepID=UPI003002F613
MRILTAATGLALLVGSSLGAAAADVYAPYDPNPATPAPAAYDYGDTDFVFILGIGGIVLPEFEGAEDYEIRPQAIVSVEYLSIPGLGAFGGPDGRGFSIGPSFNYVGERDSSDFDELDGLDDVDDTFEAGVKASYEWEHAEIYGAVRYAFGGAEGVVGDIGANLIARPTERLVLKAGPTASFASSDYMDAYFGVTTSESFNTGGRLAPYDPDGGFKSVGVAASARYEVFTDWFVNADASYDRLVGDAKDSPIVEAGDANQFTFGLGISKRFSLDLW